MKVFIVILVMFVMVSFQCATAQERIVFDFEDGVEGWDIPDWATEQHDHVGTSLGTSDEEASSGANSLELVCDFPGDQWAFAVAEYAVDMDLRGEESISVDIYLPKKARGDLYQARIILIVGPWWRMEQRWSVPLKRGEWTTITAKLDVTMENELSHWKRKTKEASLTKHLDNVRKIVVRIEYNASPSLGGPPYEGPIYIDNVVIE